MSTTPDHKKTPSDSNTLPKTPKKKLSYSSMIQTSLTVAALATALGTLYFSHQWHQHSLTQSQFNQKTTDHLQQQLQHTREDMTQLLDHINQTDHVLTEKISRLNQDLNQTLQQRWYQNNDWLLLKIRYYMELAQINAHWSDQADITVALLQEADDLLATLHDERVLTIRQSIAQEVSSLNAIPKQDVIRTLSRIDTIQTELGTLPAKRISIPSSNQKAYPQLSDQTSHSWQAIWQTSLQQLAKLVVIQHHDKPIQAPVTDEYQALLRENIRLNLQEIQWAVLHSNNDVYHMLLSQVMTHIDSTFDVRDAKVATVLTTLKALQDIQLTKPQISLQDSLTLLNQWIASKDAQTPLPPDEHDAPQPLPSEPTS